MSASRFLAKTVLPAPMKVILGILFLSVYFGIFSKKRGNVPKV
jgi:hypothetical protein